MSAIHEWIQRGSLSKDIAKQNGAIELVRCEDCAYWHPCNLEEGDMTGFCRKKYCPCENRLTDITFFCEEAERDDNDA